MAKSKRHGLYKREGGIYAFRYKDREGRWRERYTGETNLQQAKALKDEFERNLKDGTLPTEKSAWTVAQAAGLWVEQHAAHLGSEKVKSNERSLLRQLAQRLGARKLKNVTIDDLKAYQAQRHQEVGERAVNLELRILANVLKETNLWGPIGKYYKPLKERESDLGQALTLAELSRLETTAATNPAWEVAYHCEVLAANTGMRGGEIKRLRLRDINLEARRLRIQRHGTKSDAGARLVELNQAATEAVTKLYLRAQTLGACESVHYLLPADLSRHTKETDPLKGSLGFDASRHQVSWRSAWRSLRNAAGLDGVRFHDLRHSFISLMAERGVPLPVVQSMVGHLSAKVTRHYTHISSQAARQAVELLDKDRFVGNLVGNAQSTENNKPKLLN
jgi:integrase